METIHLSNALPAVFSAGRDTIKSDVWLQDLELRRGSFYLIKALSGTGKSSLCSYLMGQRHDYEGKILFDGTDIRSYRQADWVNVRQRVISHMYQELRLFPELTALENVEIKNRLTNHLSQQQILDWFDMMGIAAKRDAKVGLMSFGQQQRVAFIRALAQPFDFLIIDEPVSHLDDINSDTMSAIATDVCRQTGAGLIVTSIGRHLNITYDKVLEM